MNSQSEWCNSFPDGTKHIHWMCYFYQRLHFLIVLCCVIKTLLQKNKITLDDYFEPMIWVWVNVSPSFGSCLLSSMSKWQVLDASLSTSINIDCCYYSVLSSTIFAPYVIHQPVSVCAVPDINACKSPPVAHIKAVYLFSISFDNNNNDDDK